MKRKSLLAFGLTSILSAHAVAMDIVGGNLLGHKETTSAQSTAVFKDLKVPAAKLTLLKNKLKLSALSESYIQTSVHALPVRIDVFMPLLQGDHFFLFENYSDTPHTYTIKNSVCSAIDDSSGLLILDRCASAIDTVQLDPKGFTYGDIKSELLTSLDPSKNYVETAETEIRDETGTVTYVSNDQIPVTLPKFSK